MKVRDDLDRAMQYFRRLQDRRLRLVASGKQDPVTQRQLQELDAELARLAPVRTAWIRREFFSGRPRAAGA